MEERDLLPASRSKGRITYIAQTTQRVHRLDHRPAVLSVMEIDLEVNSLPKGIDYKGIGNPDFVYDGVTICGFEDRNKGFRMLL